MSTTNPGGDVPSAMLVQSPYGEQGFNSRFHVKLSCFGTHELPAFEDYTLTHFGWAPEQRARARNDIWVLLAIDGYRLSKGSVPRAVRWLKSQVYGEVFDAKSSLECNTSNEFARCCTCLIPSAFCAFSIIFIFSPYPIISVTFIGWVFPW